MEDVKDFRGVTSKLSSRVRTSIIEGRGEVVFFAEQSSATRRADRKRRRFFAMAVVAGIQWEDRFYSGLNPVMPARVASRSHSRTRSRCHASVCVRVRERVGRCRSLAPPRNGRCRCRCLSLSLRLLSFLFPTLSLSLLYFLLFFLYLPLFSLSLSVLSLPPRPGCCRSSPQDNVWSGYTKEERKVSKGEKIRVGRILLHGRVVKIARGGA